MAAEPRVDHEAERQSSWLELFFDLVFVAAIAALASQLDDEGSLKGLAVFGALFVPVWWAWWGFTWFSAGFETDDGFHRVSVLLLMVIAAAAATSVDDVQGGSSDGFVVAYAAFFLVLAGLYGRAWLQVPDSRQLTKRYLIGDVLGASLLLVSLALEEGQRPFLWVAAMLVLMSFPVLAARSLPFISYNRRHIAERYGLFTIIVLGEAVVGVVNGIDAPSSFAASATAGLGFAMAATIWWVYFGRWRAMPEGGIRSGWVWAQGHLLVFAGIAAASVGVEACIEAAAQGTGLSAGERLPLGAGLASYLLAMSAIRAATRRADWVVALRLATAAVTLGISAIGGISPLALVATCTCLLIGEALIELAGAPAPSGERPSSRLPHEIREARSR